MTARRIGWGLLVAAVVAGLGAYAWARARVSRELRDRRAALAASFERHHAEFLADQEWAATLPLPPARAGDRDAGPFLNPRLRWFGRDAVLAAFRASIPAGTPSLALDAARTKAVPADWWAAAPSSWEGLDFGWMAALSGFDRWDLEAGGPRPEGEPRWDPPSPDLSGVVTWAKLRLAKGLASGEPAAAAAEVAELARLLMSTESRIALILGVRLLTLNERARLQAGAAPGAWSALDADAEARLRRASDASVAYFLAGVPERYAADAGRIGFGRCAAIQEALTIEELLRPLLADAHPAEYARVARALEAAPACRLGTLRRAWASAPRAPGRSELCGSRAGVSDRLACELEVVVMRVPPLRALYGEFMWASAAPDPFWRYANPRGRGGPGAEGAAPPRPGP